MLVPAAFWGDIALDEDDLRLLKEFQRTDGSQQTEHLNHTDSGTNGSINASLGSNESIIMRDVFVTGNGTTIRRKRAAKGLSVQRWRRAATSRPERIWPEGIIPYVISGNFSGES